MSDYHINVFFSDEDGGYIADIPDLEACSAFGTSPEEALLEVAKAKEAWLAPAREANVHPARLTTGTPIHSESHVVVIPLNGNVSRLTSIWL